MIENHNMISNIKYGNTDIESYKNFINECLSKVYTCETHRHHILPTFMGGKNKKHNIIKLSVDDHCKAHIILAECFPSYTSEYSGNIKAAAYLCKWKDLSDELKVHLESLNKGYKLPSKFKNLDQNTVEEFGKGIMCFLNRNKLKLGEGI